MYEPRQRVAFRIPVKSVSFKSFDYRRHRECAIARLVELFTTYTTILRQIERCPRDIEGSYWPNDTEKIQSCSRPTLHINQQANLHVQIFMTDGLRMEDYFVFTFFFGVPPPSGKILHDQNTLETS